jgi:hypothetical protein
VNFRSTVALLLVAISCLGGCRFQDLTPGNARHDEATLPGVVTAFYQAIAGRDRPALERTTLPAATALMATDRGPIVLVPMHTVTEVPERRNQGGGARIVRTELHTDGDVATDRVSVTAKSGDGRREYEASDMVTLAHRAGRWQVAHVMFGPWRVRSGP